jgi:hypothetical protein
MIWLGEKGFMTCYYVITNWGHTTCALMILQDNHPNIQPVALGFADIGAVVNTKQFNGLDSQQ